MTIIRFNHLSIFKKRLDGSVGEIIHLVYILDKQLIFAMSYSEDDLEKYYFEDQDSDSQYDFGLDEKI